MTKGKKVITITWFGLVIASMAGLFHYELAPGASAAPSVDWPQSTHIQRTSNHDCLILFLHPQCPCSRATLSELATVMAHAGDQVEAHAIFVIPHGAPANWSDTDLLRQAAAIPGVTVSTDPGAVEAHAFGAKTSGDVSFYDPDGRLLFNGGITDGRGHEGDNAGADALLAIFRGEQPAVRATSVFGCPLE
jgi:hypothetical protein